MDVSHSVLFQCISWTKFKVFFRTENFLIRRQAFTRSQHGFLRSEEDVNLDSFTTLGVWVLVIYLVPAGPYGQISPLLKVSIHMNKRSMCKGKY